jgi:hypothetical protein
MNYDNWEIGFCPGPTDKYVEQEILINEYDLEMTNEIKYNYAISCFNLATEL